MTCDETRDTLSAYLDEAIAPDERSLVDAHLEGCADCRRELEALRGTVALLQRVEPARAPVGFGDRVVAAARPRPWYRRVADAVLLPLSVKLPLEATAVLMVGLLAVYLFERTPELQRAAREVAPSQEAAAPTKEKPAELLADKAPPSLAPSTPAPAETPAPAAGERDRADAPLSREVTPQITASPPPVSAPAAQATPAPPPAPSAPTAVSPPPPMAEPPPEVKAQVKKEAENAAAAARSEAESRQRVLAPRAGGDSARAGPSASRLAAKRVLPSADVVARVAVKDRDAAERELTALIARLDGSVTQRRREDEATVVEAVIPQPRYAEFSDGVARIGAWQVEAERRELPAQVHVILRLQ
ncbi:MAG TPA: zf-HC2 domain-containing protein [Methylomirabilota bacterium]|nr:zf-HC2 domain-containing protein [Methylomirabilota bacterium]